MTVTFDPHWLKAIGRLYSNNRDVQQLVNLVHELDGERKRRDAEDEADLATLQEALGSVVTPVVAAHQMRATLEQIAKQDYRGPRPVDASLSEACLKHLGLWPTDQGEHRV